jgi:leucyl aminopeptidase
MKTLILVFLFSVNTWAHNLLLDPAQKKPVLADMGLLKLAKIPVIYSDPQTGVAYTLLTADMEQRLSEAAHSQRRCGGYEVLPETDNTFEEAKLALRQLNQIKLNHRLYSSPIGIIKPIEKKPEIQSAVDQLSADNIRTWVSWLSSFETRYNKGPQANAHVYEMVKKLEVLKSQSLVPFQVDLVDHKSTPQKSIRVRIEGSTRPDEVIVLGGHLDSINGWGGTGKAPGADDNASGSSSLVEALRVLIAQPQPQRSIEFYWYAGEESGLLGSAEIAETAKQQQRKIIAVLQLDMTMYPGDGVNNITSIADYTSPWLRDYLERINSAYIGANINKDECGYACSDHASWYRRGFPTLMPTEAKFSNMFSMLHTEKDVISSVMSFEHSLIFSKIALVMALELGNSSEKEIIQ